MTSSLTPTHTLTVAQAAEALGVSERTVWRYLKSGRLAGETVGEPGQQRTLIDREAVAALQSERGDGPEAAALRAERDRLAAELARAQAEREALTARVALLQRAVARPRPGMLARAAERALAAAARARGPRVFSVR